MLAEEPQLVEDQQDGGSQADPGSDLKAKAKDLREDCSVGLPNEESMLSRQLRVGDREGRLVQQRPFGLGNAAATEATLACFGSRSK